MDNIDSIWDEPAEESITRTAPPPNPELIEEIFGDIPDDLGLGDDPLFDLAPLPEFDIEAERRKAKARYANKTTSSNGLDGLIPGYSQANGANTTDGPSQTEEGEGEEAPKKIKKQVARLDENRLIGPQGFPRLISDTKNFKLKGKGHEASDLNRLLNIYQYWTHQLYPKTKFKDTVDRVEKLCHSRRMHNALSMWKDEALGIQPRKDVMEDDDLDEEAVENNSSPTQPRSQSARGLTGLASSSPSQPPSSVVTDHEGDLDVDDAFIREIEDAVSAQLGGIQKENNMDAEMLFLDELPDPDAQNKQPTTAPPLPEEDDFMWDMLDEMDATAAPAPASKPTGAAYVSTVEEDWGDMYE